MSTVKLNVNIDAIKGLEQKLVNDVFDETTKLEAHNELRKFVDPWVPFLEGPLSQNVEVTSEHVRYLQPYAVYQYYGLEFNHTVEHHPLASAMWDKEAMRVKGGDFNNTIRNIIIRRLKEI